MNNVRRFLNETQAFDYLADYCPVSHFFDSKHPVGHPAPLFLEDIHVPDSPHSIGFDYRVCRGVSDSQIYQK